MTVEVRERLARCRAPIPWRNYFGFARFVLLSTAETKEFFLR